MAPVNVAVNIVLSKFGDSPGEWFTAVVFEPFFPGQYTSTISRALNKRAITITKSKAPKKIQKKFVSGYLDHPNITTKQDARRQPTSTGTRNLRCNETSAFGKLALQQFQ